MYYVYRLLDYKGFVFYVGTTKNLAVRITEHSQNKNASPAKAYRVRKCIEVHGRLIFDTTKVDTLAKARKLESDYIKEFKNQLVNIQHGKYKSSKGKTRKSGRSTQCLSCLNWYKRIKAHKCDKILA